MTATDDELMLSFRGGEVAAFSGIVERYHDFLVRFFRVRGRSASASDDLAQDVWRKVFRARHEYTAKAPFRAYLARIARNHLIDVLRGSEARHAPVSLDAPAGGCADGGRAGLSIFLAGPEADPADEAQNAELRSRLTDALMQLPEPQRETFVLCQLEEMRYEDAAEVLGVPVGTVKSRIFNAVRRLRDALRAEVS